MNRYLLPMVSVLLFVALATCPTSATGAVITPTDVSTSTATYPGYPIGNVIDGSTHFNSSAVLGPVGHGTWGGPYTVRFTLAAEYDLTQFNLWNNSGSIANDGEGVGSFTLHFFDDVLAEISTFDGSANDFHPKQEFTFATVQDVKYVDFEILSNNSATRRYACFVEVNFNGTESGGGVIPEPTSLAVWSLLGMTCIGAGCWRRRRKPAA